jgi:FkbM family methyltransferase
MHDVRAKNSKATALRKYGALSAVLEEAGLKFVDVGGRGEAFSGIVTLAEFSHYYVSEPDGAEAARLQERLPVGANWRGVTVFTDAIAARPGTALLHVTQRPGMSSLLEPDASVAGRFYLGAAYAIVNQVPVSTITLDAAAARYGFEDASFLKMDTQGTELDILQSGPGLVRDSLVAVHTEVHFRPFYKDQPLFAEVDHYLRGNGFSLLSLSRTSLRRLGYDPSLFSRRTTTWAHCLYIREPDQLLRSSVVNPGRGLVRLLALAIALKHFDLALDVVADLGQQGLLTRHDHASVSADVRRAAIDGTRYARRKIEEQQNAAEGLLAGSRRDDRRID